MDARILRRRLTALWRRFRRPLAALLAFIGVLAALSVVRPAPPPTVSAIVAVRDLPSGTRLQSGDLTVIQIPADYLAPGAMGDPGEAEGLTLSAPLAAGEVLTRTRLAAAAVSHERGTYAVPLRLDDAGVAALLAPGMVIDIVRGARGSAEIIADGVRVITVPRRSTTPSFGDSGQGESGSLVLVAADRTTAIRLAAAGTTGDLAAILR